MLTCYERCLYLLYSQICTYCMKIFIFAPYRRVYSSSSVDYICVHVCPTQEGTHACMYTFVLACTQSQAFTHAHNTEHNHRHAHMHAYAHTHVHACTVWSRQKGF